jgi:hypothetical protein
MAQIVTSLNGGDRLRLNRMPRVHALRGGGLGFRDLLEFEQQLLKVLCQIADHFAVPQQFRNIAGREHQIEMIGATGLLGHLQLARQ